MIGTNITFFAMILLGYGGMPRRYATYDLISVGPLGYFTDLHMIAMFGAVLLLIGQIFWLWNIVSSYFEGRPLEDADPWSLKDEGMWTREWDWFEGQRETALTDGGEEDDLAADSGTPDAETTDD
jgi:cytochrome c oxidase subunit 1